MSKQRNRAHFIPPQLDLKKNTSRASKAWFWKRIKAFLSLASGPKRERAVESSFFSHIERGNETFFIERRETFPSDRISAVMHFANMGSASTALSLFVCVLLLSFEAAESANRCGVTFGEATCGTPCPGGTDGECPSGQTCFANVNECLGLAVNRCGTSFGAASCGTSCPLGLDGECSGVGETCFANVDDCTLEGVGDPCQTGGGEDGTCVVDTDCTNGVLYSGLCPGPSNVRCCVGFSGVPCTTDAGIQGSCEIVTSCNGTSYPGFCPGPTEVQCCVDETTGSPTIPCQVGSTPGECVQVETCTGSSVPGYCPGPTQIQCCVNDLNSDVCTVPGLGDGVCKNIAFCDGTTTPGYCPGPTEIQCCTANSFTTAPTDPPAPTPVPVQAPDGPGCVVGVSSGTCIDVSACTNGISIAGYCPGASNIQCCVPVTGTPFTPNPPDTSGSLGSCITTYNMFSGQCINVAECTGATFNDLCPGSTSIKCCATETTPVPLVSSPYILDQATFETLFTGISSTRAVALRPYFNFAVTEINLDAPTPQVACYRMAAFVAQIGFESGGLRYFEEIASGEAYNGRTGLGNTQPGDGPRFKGRGPIQLTGRANYRSAGQRLGVDLEANPELVSFPSMGFLTTVDYWMSRDLNRWASSNQQSDFDELTRRINGGYNGLAGRTSRWETAKNLLGCSVASAFPYPTPAPTPPTPQPSSPSTPQPTPDSGSLSDEPWFVPAVAGGSAGFIIVALSAVLVFRGRARQRDLMMASPARVGKQLYVTGGGGGPPPGMI